MELDEGTKIHVLAPMIRGKKGEHKGVFESARKSGFARVRADGILYDLSEDIILEKNKKHSVEIVVDRLVIKESIRSRLADSLETASKMADGLVLVSVLDGEDILYSQNYACPEHGNYLVRVKCRKSRDAEAWSANKLVYEADEDMLSFYKSKASQARRRSRGHASRKNRPAGK